DPQSAFSASREGLASTPCKHIISGTISLRSQRFFSPFPRGTCSLSVANEYLGLRRGRRRFIRSFTCIVLLRKSLGVLGFSVTGLSPFCAPLSKTLPLPFPPPVRPPPPPPFFSPSPCPPPATPGKGALCRAIGAANRSTNSKHMNESGLACSAFARH